MVDSKALPPFELWAAVASQLLGDSDDPQAVLRQADLSGNWDAVNGHYAAEVAADIRNFDLDRVRLYTEKCMRTPLNLPIQGEETTIAPLPAQVQKLAEGLLRRGPANARTLAVIPSLKEELIATRSAPDSNLRTRDAADSNLKTRSAPEGNLKAITPSRARRAAEAAGTLPTESFAAFQEAATHERSGDVGNPLKAAFDAVGWSVQAYAKFRAEVEQHADNPQGVLRRYGLDHPRALTHVQSAWASRLKDDPVLRGQFRQALEGYRRILQGS